MQPTSKVVTLEEVWRLFHETDRKFQETDRKFQETDRKFHETDRKFQETDRKFQEAREEMRKSSQETDRQLQETFNLIKETRKAIGELSGRLGQFVEEMVKPAAVRLFRERGMEVHRVLKDMEASYGDDGIQVDLLVINGDEAVVIECKSKLSVDDVNEHIKRIEKFKRFWPEYKHFRLAGAVAAMVAPDDVAKYAYRKGLYVLVQNGDIIDIKNDEKFRPVMW